MADGKSKFEGVNESYLAEYFGVWAMHEPALNAMVDTFNAADIPTIISNHAAHRIAPSAADSGGFEIYNGNVAIIRMSGTIMKHRSSFGGASTIAYRRRLSNAMKDPEVTAILQVFDTPGGTVAGTQDAAAAADRARQTKPIYSFVEDLCASAGYWIASQAEKIYANQPTALPGGIGTFTTLVDTSEMAEKNGVKVHLIAAGKLKGAGTPGTKITDEMIKERQSLINSLNEQFVSGVAKGRGVTIDKVNQWADGRIHTANIALEMGLIDGIKPMEAVLSEISEKHNSRAQTMDPKNDATATNTAPSQPASEQPATLQQLRSACPGASSDFLIEMQDKKATVSQATAAMIESQNKQLAEHKAAAEARDTADKEAAEAAATASANATTNANAADGNGLDPLVAGQGGDEAEAGGDLAQQFQAKVAEQVKAGKPRLQAIQSVGAAHPKMHQAYIVATNPNSGPVGRMVADKISMQPKE